jgi:predicted TIM-barrel fold metal-dependent hydrolase
MTTSAGARVIDTDGHVNEPEDLWARFLPPELLPMAPRRLLDDQGRLRNCVAGEFCPPIPYAPEWSAPGRPTGGWDPKARLVDMDADGIDVAVLFPTTGLFFAGIADDHVQAALCRAYNDWLAEYAATDPARLVGVAVIPQTDVGASIAEARRAVRDLGFKGVMFRPNPVRGRNLHDPVHDPLWDALEDLGVPLCVHEGTTLNLPQAGLDRFENFAFRHAVSHPHEQQMALLSLACGGVLEHHPGLRVAFLESGCGWIAWWLERLDEHMEEWAHATAPLPHEPSEYFARQCWISTEPDERTLPAVISMMGADNLIFASDYPHPDGIFPGVVAALADRTDVSAADKAKILSANAERLFRL